MRWTTTNKQKRAESRILLSASHFRKKGENATIDEKTILKGILDSYPYPIVFVDNDYIIRYLNRYAQYHYYQERGDCHDREVSRERIKVAYEKMKSDGKEVFIGVNARNQRYYMQGVRDEEGNLIGFFERFELNLQK